MPMGDRPPVKLQFEERNGYLHATVSGSQDSLPAALDYWPRIIDACYESGNTKLLVEEDFPNQLSTIEIFEVIQAIRARVTSPLKIAFFDRASEADDLNLFGETVAVNRGIHGRVFSDRSAAETWLKSDLG